VSHLIQAMTKDCPESRYMLRALELARQGQGFVEPNPLVGCVIVRGSEIVGEGWHRRFGGPHAEVEALAAAGSRAAGATLYVTLEPCCHHGKTAPCSAAVAAAGIRRVVAALRDPFPQVDGGGFGQLRAAGIDVEVGLCAHEARELNAPYLKLLATGQPWVIAKWAMSLDGKLATGSGDSRWISNASARGLVHELRGRVDAIAIGRRTAERDDPLLTSRLERAPPRIATRIVLDSRAQLSSSSQLVRTARQWPTLVVAGPEAKPVDVERLSAAGCEVLQLAAGTHRQRVTEWLLELGRRRLTNVLVEGGSELLSLLFDAGEIDEVHLFIAPKLIGGAGAPTPWAGAGVDRIANARSVISPRVQLIDGDIYVQGRLEKPL
jgi:diaminohydroxyphosphoribosylaminopyrimidine deaminase / 5-amino-6-(5-phosphoribosylamino)uracil reductase